MLNPSDRRNGITYTHDSYVCLIQVIERKVSINYTTRYECRSTNDLQYSIEKYQGTGILKSDCQQPLRIGIIRALNECTGDLLGPRHGTTTRALICKVKKDKQRSGTDTIRSHIQSYKPKRK